MTKPQITVKTKSVILYGPLLAVIASGLLIRPEIDPFSGIVGIALFITIISPLVFLMICPKFMKKFGYKLI